MLGSPAKLSSLNDGGGRGGGIAADKSGITCDIGMETAEAPADEKDWSSSDAWAINETDDNSTAATQYSQNHTTQHGTGILRLKVIFNEKVSSNADLLWLNKNRMQYFTYDKMQKIYDMITLRKNSSKQQSIYNLQLLMSLLNQFKRSLKRLCLVSWAAAPRVWTLRALTKNLLSYLLTYI